MTTFWIDAQGTLLRATSDPNAQPPDAVTSTEIAPESGKQKWNGTGWNPAPPPPPDPDIALDAAINGAASLTALKAALRGKIAARQ